jgi:TRAP-type C4-dicarboxylate transport system permease small subunit
LASRQRRALPIVARVIAIVCALAAAILAVYCVMLTYAAATFDADSLPGPAVLYMVAVGVGLVAVLCGGFSHVLWRMSKRSV